MSAARVGELAAALHLPRVGFDRQVQAAVGLAGDAGLVRSPLEADRRGLGAREPAEDEREIAQRLRRGEQVDLRGSAPDPCRRATVGKPASSSPLATQSMLGGTVMPKLRGRVVGDRRLRIPVAAAAVQEARLGLNQHRLVVRPAAPAGPARAAERFAVRRLRLEPAGVGDRQRQLAVAQQRRRQVDDERVLVPHADAEQPAELDR